MRDLHINNDLIDCIESREKKGFAYEIKDIHHAPTDQIIYINHNEKYI